MTAAQRTAPRKETVGIAALAGYSGDRIGPAVDVLRNGDVNYGVFECLAERTIALAQRERLKDPKLGYDPLLVRRMEAVIPICERKGIKIITNMGAANPVAAANVVRAIVSGLGIKGMKVSVVLGDDIFDKLDNYADTRLTDDATPGMKDAAVRDLPSKISANAYLGAEGIVKALEGGADIVITGRVADSSLFLAIPMFEFGWHSTDYGLLGNGIVAGHLLECGAQVTGGYFYDGHYETKVPNLWNVGFPIAEISSGGTVLITKAKRTGGMVTKATCTAQLLYEIHDPGSYITPDAVADFSHVDFREVAKNRIMVEGATARERTDTLKVSIGYIDDYMGRGEIGYSGDRARERAIEAADIVVRRLKRAEMPLVGEPLVEIIGDVSPSSQRKAAKIESKGPYHMIDGVRLYVSARALTKEAAAQVGSEVETLYLNGPAGGGGARSQTEMNVAIASILVPRRDVPVRVE